MNSLGFNVRGLCSEGSFTEELQKEKLPLDLISMSREISPLKDLVSLFKLFCYFKKARPGIVFTHTPKAGILGPVAARLAGVPWVVHVAHGFMIHDQAPLKIKILGWIMEKNAAIWSHICLSQSREDILKSEFYKLISRKRLKYLGNGINCQKYDPDTVGIEKRKSVRSSFDFKEDAFVVGFVGRLVQEKGIRELFSAIPKVLSKFPHVRFIIIGPMEPDQGDNVSEEEVEKMRTQYQVVFTGFSNNLGDLYSALDLYVLPTYREGVPRALMEASAMLVPAIATDIRGCREVIVPNETGWLVKPRSAEALAEKIIHTVSLPKEVRRKMGNKARAHIQKKFNEKRVMRRFSRICQVLLKRMDRK
ncbi:MAG: glycosyltransferase family 4 protein [Nitrospina sp.]|nr:glycosyltransferase family 4 protein [Nitrospina sp.]